VKLAEPPAAKVPPPTPAPPVAAPPGPAGKVEPKADTAKGAPKKSDEQLKLEEDEKKRKSQ
jgi:hypothetical protein